ncbi:transcription elongation factor GreA [Candidatus Berkelbacteria bacterium]|nr:transcription elongation factor GreA [Candidatus Berkelbacteria bacterium]
MAQVPTHQLTPDGLAKLEAELKDLKTVQRPDAVKRMAAARELGDLSENADYHDAREQLAFVEGRIEELEYMIKHAEIITPKGASGSVQMGSQVTVKDEGGKTLNFLIVGANESDPVTGKISSESPVGAALMGQTKGDAVTVSTPSGPTKYTIVSVG